jgi:hypothetical protein
VIAAGAFHVKTGSALSIVIENDLEPVAATLSTTSIVNDNEAPLTNGVPVMRPVFGSTLNPAGLSADEYVNGAVPPLEFRLKPES